MLTGKTNQHFSWPADQWEAVEVNKMATDLAQGILEDWVHLVYRV